MKTNYFLRSFLMIVAMNSLNAATIYVDASRTSGLNNGTDWNNAFISFQQALNTAVGGDEIWVAKGTYKPSSAYDLTNSPRYFHFRMKNDVAIYGGFSGTETSVSQRVSFGFGEMNETILSGDLNEDDVVSGNGPTLSFSNNSENCYHVFYNPPSLSLNNNAILNGFTIKGGNANDVHPNENGGGMYNLNQSPALVNIYITENFSIYTGGGISNGTSSPIFENIYFSRNQAGYGGGMYSVDSYVIMKNCVVAGNKATDYGGGLCSNNTSHTLGNLTITDNVADIGGGIYTAYVPFNLSNCIVRGNTATTYGNEIGAYNGGSVNYDYSCYKDGANDEWLNGGSTTKNNSINTDPKFANVYERDYRLAGNSPCADAGNNSLSTEVYDIRGIGYDRKLNKIDGTSGTIDMGAYEYKFGTDPSIPCVNPTDGGLIAPSQMVCSNSVPGLISNSISASGFSGTLEYQWYSSTTNNSSGFSAIVNATNDSYQPGMLSQTTWLKRLARVSCMSNWNGAVETNVIEIMVNPAYSYSANAAICQGQSYTWQGNTFTATGTYTANYTSIHGCDSTFHLNLTVNPTYVFNENHSICNGQTYNWQGSNYTTAGTYTASYSSIQGCDSSYVLNLIVNPAYAFTESHAMCNGQTYNWQGNNYTSAGTYTANYSSIQGCDSSYVLNLTVNPAYAFTESHTMCNGQIYNWQGSNYTTAGTYSASYSSIQGCDSSYVLNLNITAIDVSITTNGPTIFANLSGETYQWLDCNDNYSPINGATSQSYTPTANGSYAVLISQGNCSDTSICVLVTNVGMRAYQLTGSLIYPNPIVSELIIEMNGNTEITGFEIFDSMGQMVNSGNFSGKIIIPADTIASGVYYLKLKNGNNLELKKIIKQ